MRLTDRAIPLALTLLLVTACDNARRADPLASDTSLMQDLALANQDTARQPELADVPATAEPQVPEPEIAPSPVRPAPRTRPPSVSRATRPAPVVRRPAPAPVEDEPVERVTESGNIERSTPRGSEGALGVVSPGSAIELASSQRVCTNTHSVGDRFTAVITEPVMGANGTVIPVGALAHVSVSSLERSDGSGETIEIGLRVESISFGGKTYQVASEVTYAQVDRVRAQSRSDDARKVATGAAIGAVVGGILGGRTRSAVIGAATGAAAGAVVANRNADYDGCVPSGGRITIRLTEPLTIQLTE